MHNDGDGDGDDGRTFPEHPSPILHAPRDNISRKGKSLIPIYIYKKHACPGSYKKDFVVVQTSGYCS